MKKRYKATCRDGEREWTRIEGNDFDTVLCAGFDEVLRAVEDRYTTCASFELRDRDTGAVLQMTMRTDAAH